jgi:uncharacterized protein YggE
MKHVTLAACLLVFVLGELPYPARAAEPTTLTVSGQGSVSKAPDSALIDVAIVTSDDASAAKATAQNNTAYDRLRERLRGLGVRDDAIRTTSFGVHYVARPSATREPLGGAPPPLPPGRYGYVATRNLTITAPRVDAAGTVVDAAVAIGADVNDVRYTLADQRATVAQALSAAVADAQMQAESVAQAAHLRITGIKSIDVSSAPVPVAFAARAAAPAPPQTEITPTPLDVRASVSVTYYVAP